MQQVRLSPEQISVIKQSFEKRFLKGDRLWIFGSRANMSKKGGDIDIYIETNAQSLDDALKMKQNLYVDLQIGLGEQKIDIVVNTLKFPHDLKIHEVAKNEGVNII